MRWEDTRVDMAVVGIVLATIGACTSGFGMNMLKASSRLERGRPLWRRYRFILGISLACWVNTALDCVAFALTPLAIIAPIGGVTIVASVLFAHYGCAGEREYVSWAQWVAIATVVGGVAMVDVYGPHPEPVLNSTVVLSHFHDEAFIGYQVLAFSTTAFVYWAMYLGKLGGPTLETTIFTAIASGLCSGMTQTMLKLVATCVADYLLHDATPFHRPEFWVALVELLLVAIVLLHLLNVCITSANLALSTPIYQVCIIVFTVVAGCAYYGDLDVATRAELLMFFLGVSCVLGGLAVLVAHREHTGGQLLPTSENKVRPARRPYDT